MKIAIEIYTTEAKTWHSDDLILIDPDWRYCTLQLHREGFTCINWNDGNDFFFFRQQLEISLLCSRFRGVKSHISPFWKYQKRRWTLKKKLPMLSYGAPCQNILHRVPANTSAPGYQEELDINGMCRKVPWILQTFVAWSETTLRQERESVLLLSGGWDTKVQ